MVNYNPTPTNFYEDYIAHYGVKGMKWKNRKSNSLKAKWTERDRTNPLRNHKDYNATGQNRDQQFYEQSLERNNVKSRTLALKNRKNKLKKVWENRELHSTDRMASLRRQGYKDWNATSQNRDQQFREQKLTKKRKK